MLMKQIRQYFERAVHFSDKDWEIFSSRLTMHQLPKKTLLLKENTVENTISFIEKGIIRFFISKGDYELTFSFAFADSFVSAYDSFLTQTPCLYNVETLSESILWRINYHDLQNIYAKTKIGNTIGRLASEELFLKKCKRELSLLHDTPEERYLKLFTEQLHLLHHIPLKYIASYIGITPQALSRIRKRIS